MAVEQTYGTEIQQVGVVWAILRNEACHMGTRVPEFYLCKTQGDKSLNSESVERVSACRFISSPPNVYEVERRRLSWRSCSTSPRKVPLSSDEKVQKSTYN